MREDVARWQKMPQLDLAGAETLAGNSLWAGAAFFCQQCCEKLLKAALVASDSEPPRTHDLVELADLAGLDPTADQKLFLTRLSDHAVRSRYPGAEYDETGVRQILQETRQFFQRLRAKLT